MGSGNLAFGIQRVVTAVIDYGSDFVAKDAQRFERQDGHWHIAQPVGAD